LNRSTHPTEAALDATSSEIYRHLVTSMPDYAIFALDTDGKVLAGNPGVEGIKEYRPEEVVGRHFSFCYLPEDVAANKPSSDLETAAREGRIESTGWRVRKDGSRFWADVIITAVRNEQGELTGFTHVMRDLTVRRATEESLRQSEERFQLLVQGVQDYAILALDTKGHIRSWNEGTERVNGYTADEILSHSFQQFYPQEAIAAGIPASQLETASRVGRFEGESWQVRKDGSRFWANVIITAQRDTEGLLIGFAMVTRDLTERREAEEQARQLVAEVAAHAEDYAEVVRRSEELARLNEVLQNQTAELEMRENEERRLVAELKQANDNLLAALDTAQAEREAAVRSAAAATEAYRELDQFAYVASHDLKAPLRGIANLAQWIQDDVGEGLSAESLTHMRLLQGRVHRMEALIDGILTYSRAGRMLNALEPVDTGVLVREVIELLAPTSAVTIQVPDDMPTLEAERVPLQQIFMNLISNALKYTQAVRPDVVIHIEWRDLGDALEFSVSDNGPGIASAYHERIWGIFQTLAARDKVEGTGIGLSVVKKIVETRGGSVAVESAPDQGATFRFTWPKTFQKGGHV